MTTPKVATNRTIAVWLALFFGFLGIHRLYLLGSPKVLRDVWFWLHGLGSGLGLWGVQRAITYGQDDKLAWFLIPFLGFSMAAACGTTIYFALIRADRWQLFCHSTKPLEHSDHTISGLDVTGAVFALMVGAIALVASIVFSFQRYFEYQVEEAQKISQGG